MIGSLWGSFDRIFQERGIEVRSWHIRSPNLNAYVERFIQSIQKECLDHFLIFGEKHFDYLVRSMSSTITRNGRIRVWEIGC